MPFRRTRQNQCILLMAFAPFLCIIYTLHANVEGPKNLKTVLRSCKTIADERKALLELIRSTHKVLNKLKIKHFLAYGSLWGAARFKNPLPWDYDFDFGVIGKELFEVPEATVRDSFKKENIKYFYRPYAGVYRVERGPAGGDLIIFNDFHGTGTMQRQGFESYFLFLHYRKFHQFPTRLIVGKLPVMEFAGVNVSVPHEGIEMQKYLYPTNWWKEVKPSGC